MIVYTIFEYSFHWYDDREMAGKKVFFPSPDQPVSKIPDSKKLLAADPNKWLSALT